jgi:hypothetical protein
MRDISLSESNGGDFEETLQKLIDWKEAGVPKYNGNKEGEKELFNFRKRRRQTYSGFIKTLDSYKTKNLNEEQKQQVAKWIKVFKERLERIETVWDHRKN